MSYMVLVAIETGVFPWRAWRLLIKPNQRVQDTKERVHCGRVDYGLSGIRLQEIPRASLSPTGDGNR